MCFSPPTCSVKGVVGVENCREEAEGERADPEGHVEPGVTETLEHLRGAEHRRGCDSKTTNRLNDASDEMPDSRCLDSLAPFSDPEVAGVFSTWGPPGWSCLDRTAG